MSCSGFHTAEDLIGYCELHCQTERGLFSGAQINEMMRLAGLGKGDLPNQGFYSVHEPMEALCRDARRRLLRQKLRIVSSVPSDGQGGE